MNKTKKTALSAIVAFGIALTYSQVAQADSAPGDVVITLGKDLTQEQKDALLEKMGADEKAMILDVTNEEEEKYLGKLLPKTKIGTRAISSVKITIGNEGDGVDVHSDNINWVTEDMYKNAMVTGGVTDASVEVMAPFSVSGTAALTGIFKAYESTTDTKISEEQKEVANEELITTAKLGDSIGSENAVELMELTKAALAEQNPKTPEEIEQIVQNAAKEKGIELTNEEQENIVGLLGNIKDAGVDFNLLKDEISAATKEKVNSILNSEETKGLIAKLGDFFATVVETIKGWFAPAEK